MVDLTTAVCVKFPHDDLGPNTYLRVATMAALRGEPVLLPHQLA